jgi:hypothetical protein
VSREYDLYVDQGSYYSIALELTTPNGQPIDLTDYTVFSQMRKSGSSSVGYDIDVDIIDSSNGKIRVMFTADVTSEMPAGRYFYDVVIKDDANDRLRVMEGIVTLTPQITRIV